MIQSRIFGAAAAVLVFAGISLGNEAEIKALRNEIKALRTQESTILKAIKAQYDGLVKQDRLSEEVLARERKTLAQQENELLAVAATKEDKDAIRAQYETVRSNLKAGIKLDANQIKELRALQNAQTNQVKLAFKSKTVQLEAAIKTLEKAPKPKGGKK